MHLNFDGSWEFSDFYVIFSNFKQFDSRLFIKQMMSDIAIKRLHLLLYMILIAQQFAFLYK